MISDKLDYLNETKAQIKQAIIDKGQEVSDETPFREYVQKIQNIETGIDTSDATATADDILSPKTAYVNEQKVTGNIMPTTVAQDVSTYNKIKLLDVACYYIDTYVINDIFIVITYYGVTDVMTINMYKSNEILATQEYQNVSTLFELNKIEAIGITLNEYNSEYIEYTIACGYFNAGDSNPMDFKKLKYNFTSKSFTLHGNIAYNMIEGHSVYGLNFLKDSNVKNRFNVLTSQYVAAYDDRNCMHIIDIIWNGETGTINDTAIHNVRMGFNFNVFESTGNGKYIRLPDTLVQLDNLTATITNNLSSVPYISHNLDLMLQNNKLYRITGITYNDMNNSKKELLTIPVTYTKAMFSKDDKYIICCTSDTLYVYSLNGDTLILEQSLTRTNDSNIIDVFNSYKILEYIASINTLNEYYCEEGNLFIESLQYKNNKYNYIYNKNVPANNKVLVGNTYTGLNGEVLNGTMPNNGELNYTPSTEEQIIPAGYTSGGTIAASSITSEEYDECLNLANQIAGNGGN